MNNIVPPVSSHSLLIFLLQCGVLLGLALALGRLGNRVGFPSIVGELLAGVIAGPSLLGHTLPRFEHWLFPPNAAQFNMLDGIAQIGMLLLVGLTATHVDLASMKQSGRTAFLISVSAFSLPFVLGLVIASGLPDFLVGQPTERPAFALLLGVVMGVSAIPVVAKILIELQLLDHKIGQLTLTAVMGNDIVAWVLLSVVSAMSAHGKQSAAVGAAVCFIALTIVMAIMLRRPMALSFDRLARHRPESDSVALLVCFILLAAAATQAMKLEAVFGAFICGLVVSAHVNPTAISALWTTVLAFVAPVFFAMAGLRIDIAGILHPRLLLIGLIVLLVAILGKFLGAYFGARLARLSRAEAVALGAAMNARGAVEIVVAMVGLRLGLLTSEMYTVVIIIAVVTSIMAPPVLRLTIGRLPKPCAAQDETAIAEVRA